MEQRKREQRFLRTRKDKWKELRKKYKRVEWRDHKE